MNSREYYYQRDQRRINERNELRRQLIDHFRLDETGAGFHPQTGHPLAVYLKRDWNPTLVLVIEIRFHHRTPITYCIDGLDLGIVIQLAHKSVGLPSRERQ